MSTDRELLEMAAKAAGIETEPERFSPAWGCVIRDRSLYWNPLTNDGDALRLVVRCSITLEFAKGYTAAYCGGVEGKQITVFAVNNDPYAATRRAIVRAAAELGQCSAPSS